MSHVLASDLLDLHEQSRREIEKLQKATPTSINETPKPQRPIGTPLTTLFTSLKVSSQDKSPTPTPSQCATHLELLEVLLQLRLNVLNSHQLDAVFGIEDKPKTVYRRAFVGWTTATTGNRRRTRKFENRPTLLKDTTFQERRRKKWPYFLSIAVERFFVWVIKADAVLADFDKSSQKLVLPLRCLPPLDVLMVWHAFLLNPRDFAAFCEEEELVHIRQVPFPWKQIHSAIDMYALTYTLPPASQQWHTTTATLAPDLLTYLTTQGNHGTPKVILPHFGAGETHPYTYPSSAAALEEEAAQTSLHDPSSNPNPDPNHNHLCLLRAYASRHHNSLLPLSSPARHHPSHKQASENVARQSAFVDKMHAHLWIRSPAVSGTLRRAVERYQSFVKLFALYPGKTLVPALDVDLAWHTHLCAGLGYESDMRERTGRFVDHDDKLGEGTLATALEETGELFMVRFGEGYQVCLCWDCQAVVECVEEEEEDGVGDVDVEGVVKRAGENVAFCRGEEIARQRRHPPVKSGF